MAAKSLYFLAITNLVVSFVSVEIEIWKNLLYDKFSKQEKSRSAQKTS